MAPNRTGAKLSILAGPAGRRGRTEIFMYSVPPHCSGTAPSFTLRLSEAPGFDTRSGRSHFLTEESDPGFSLRHQRTGRFVKFWLRQPRNDAPKIDQSPAGPVGLPGTAAAQVSANAQRHRADGISAGR